MSPGSGFCECGCGQRTRIAKRTDRTKGMVKGEPMRFVLGHNSRPKQRIQFRSMDCGYETPCHVWQRSKNTGDYGKFSLNDRTILAHRYVYERARGPIKPGHQLHHLCEIPACVNVEHMVELTAAEHAYTKRMVRVGMTLARRIRREVNAGEITRAEAARRYGVDPSGVSKILNNKIWVEAGDSATSVRIAAGTA